MHTLLPDNSLDYMSGKYIKCLPVKCFYIMLILTVR